MKLLADEGLRSAASVTDQLTWHKELTGNLVHSVYKYLVYEVLTSKYSALVFGRYVIEV